MDLFIETTENGTKGFHVGRIATVVMLLGAILITSILLGVLAVFLWWVDPSIWFSNDGQYDIDWKGAWD
jgi:hypothetical protein